MGDDTQITAPLPAPTATSDAYKRVHAGYPIVLFDGECNLCSSVVQLILRFEKTGMTKPLQFGSQQSAEAAQLIAPFGKKPGLQNSVIFLENGVLLDGYPAALALLRFMKAPFSWLKVFRFLPNKALAWAYGFVGRNRYKWFGKKDTCEIPSLKDKANLNRFLALD